MPILWYFQHQSSFGKVDPNALNSLEVSILTFLAQALNLLGSVNYFDQVGHEILQNMYLKTNFENTVITDFVPTF